MTDSRKQIYEQELVVPRETAKIFDRNHWKSPIWIVP